LSSAMIVREPVTALPFRPDSMRRSTWRYVSRPCCVDRTCVRVRSGLKMRPRARIAKPDGGLV
jgi:hypothetical protein